MQRVGAFSLEALPLVTGEDGARKFNIEEKIRVDFNPTEIGRCLGRSSSTGLHWMARRDCAERDS